MPEEHDKSPHGDAIYKYGEPEGWEYGQYSFYAEQIEAHIERYFGPIRTVFHEVFSNRVHVDVLAVPPTEQRPYWTFVTCGMSARPMILSDQAIGLAPRFAEVLLSVPRDWEFGSGAGAVLGDNPGDYPISLLRYVAHFPHTYSTWLGVGHTIPNGDPPAPIAASTEMCACILAPVLGANPAVNRLAVGECDEIAFYGVIPLYEAELSLKLNSGAEALYQLFDQKGVSELFDPTRPSVVVSKKQGFFGALFGRGTQ